MDVLNFISWIKNGQQVTTVDPTQTLIPLGLRDTRRDDGYRSATITAQNFINSVAPPSIVSVDTGLCSTIRTGIGNTAIGEYSTVFGRDNTAATAFSCYGAIAGGRNNCVRSYSFIGGGSQNTAQGNFSVITGGNSNYTSGIYSVVGGGNCNINSSTCAGILSGSNNNIGSFAEGSVIAGGLYNCTTSNNSLISGGYNNSVSACGSSVINGFLNVVSACYSSINGGTNNVVAGCYSSINNGCCNISCNTAVRSTILGGHFNRATCNDSFVVGSCIITDRACTTFVNNLSIVNIPTSSAGLPSKAVWSNAGVLTIVP